MTIGSSAKNLLKTVTTSLKLGHVADVFESIESWSNGVDAPVPDWDLFVGAAFWSRCIDKDAVITDEETRLLEKIYRCLIRAFIQNSKDSEHYLERIKVFAATLKYFVSVKRLNLDAIEELLHEVSKTSFYVRQHEYPSFKTVCMNFYAIIWNFMRENHAQLGLLQALAHASLSVRWLVVLGLDQFQNISHKLSQISFLLAKNQVYTNVMIADFFYNLSTKIVDLLKQVILDDANHGLKIKKKKCVLPASNFHGLLNITFVLARQLLVFGDFDKASKVFRPVTSVAQVYVEGDLRQLWKKVLDAFVKISMVLLNGTDINLTDEIVASSEHFRDCRKTILDVSFQKSYPGYAFSFMYAFTESIGFVISNSKNCSGGTTLLKLLPLSKSAKFLKEIQLAADACVALDDMESGKHTLEGITEHRKVEVYSTALFHILKVASDRICDKESLIEKNFQQVTETTFRTLMTVANRVELEEPKAAEIFNLITLYTCNIGYAYQKRKNFKEAMSWCSRSVDGYEAFKSRNVQMDLKINVLSIGLLFADCHRQMENYTEGLRWLSKWLLMAPQTVNNQSMAYDIYEQIPWTDWSVHWLAIQKEICSQHPNSCSTAVEYLEEEDPNSLTDEFVSSALRLEMNSYFTGRQTVVPAMINVGQQLHMRNLNMPDKVLGLVCQAIGLWWVATEESLYFASQCLNEAMHCLDESNGKKIEARENSDAMLRSYLSGIAIAWKALCLMKTNQIIAEREFETLKNRVILENPGKLKDKVDSVYAVSAFTSLTIEDEKKFAVNFIEAAECLYQLCQLEDAVRSIVDSHCPALAQITVRLIAMGLSALGDKINATKAWYAVFVIAKVYDRKGLTVLAAAEVLKILHDTSLECVQHADTVNAIAQEKNLIKHNKAVYYRLDLAKALACYHQKNFKQGLLYLVEVYKFLAGKDNFDSTHHLMAEADYVLSLYRSISINRPLDFPVEIPEMLCKMTPAGLSVKSFKLLGGLSRETDVLSSGWTDLLHNYYLLSLIADVNGRTVSLLKETGKLRDLKCFITDTVYFYQRLGIVSRSVAVLVPLIETDISARNFYMAQIRIAAVAKVLLALNSKSDENMPAFSEAKKFLETLKIPGMSINRLENISNLKWHLGDVEATSFHYRNQSSKYITSLKVDCETINLKSIEMKAPDFLRHPLTCFCYSCSHPDIIPLVLEFLVAQCKYAVAMKWKISMAVLELARLHHQRAMFRVLFNMDRIHEQWQPIVPRKNAVKLFQTIYSAFFFNPGFNMQLVNMEMCPIGDVSHIVHLMNCTLRATDIFDGDNLALKALPLEIGTCALYEYLVSKRKIQILGGNIRQVLQDRVEQQEKENTVLVPSSPEIMEATFPPIAPPIRRGGNVPLTKQQLHGRKATITSLRPRRILNSKAQLQPEVATVELVDLTKVDNVDEDRCRPLIPAPNFDDSNND